MTFVHLRNYTEYSLFDGVTRIYNMVKRAAELGMPAIAITDKGVMSGIPELSAACDNVEKETGIRVKPIFGCEVHFIADDKSQQDDEPSLYHLLLLAKNNTGYRNLAKLVSESHIQNHYRKPITTFATLEKYSEGIIGVSTCSTGIVSEMLIGKRYEDALLWAKQLASVYEPGDFYIELQNHGLTIEGGITQNELNHQLVKIAQDAGLDVIATNNSHYLYCEEARAQDVMLCIGMGTTINDSNRTHLANDQFYLKSEEEMRMALKDFPEACDNTVKVAEKCNVVLERAFVLPRFSLPEGETESSCFHKQCLAGLHRRYGNDFSNEVLLRYEQEADVIIKQGLSAYFLIIQEIVQWAKDKGIGVGPGRGSVTGSIVAYALGITDLDPLSNGLFFECFMPTNSVEMPDVDIDFEDERRDEVIEHVKQLYGESNVAGVITFNRLTAKNAIIDAARVLGCPNTTRDELCEMIGDEIGIPIKDAIQKNPNLRSAYETDPDSRAVLDAALSIDGLIRMEGVHACATIIGRDSLDEYVPLKYDERLDTVITQYDGHYISELGMLKMDFLGLRALSVISRVCRNINEHHGINIKPEEIPLEDEQSFALLCESNMKGLFWVDNELFESFYAKVKPKCFADITDSIALCRPGSYKSGMVNDYIMHRLNPDEVNYYDDRLRPILDDTYGVILYQEQVMQLSMVMSEFSAEKANKLRKAMCKGQDDKLLQLKEDWIKGAVENGYSREVVEQIWDHLDKCGKYTFLKAHEAAYAVIVQRMAYLKSHYPNEFMAAL